MLGCKSFVGVNLKQLADHKPKIFLQVLTQVMDLVEKGAIHVEEPMEIPWEEIGKAHQLLESRKTTGKLVMLVTDNDETTKTQEKEEQ
jgi:NADPH:quinone reductase-like Zn-dependent oxidoreductase